MDACLGLLVGVLLGMFLVWLKKKETMIDNPFMSPGNNPASTPFLGNCVYFQNVNKEASVPETAMSGPVQNSWTVMFWVKLDNLNTSKDVVLMRKGNGLPMIFYDNRDKAVKFALGHECSLNMNKDLNACPGPVIITPEQAHNTSSCATPTFKGRKLCAGGWKHFAIVSYGPQYHLYEDGKLFVSSDPVRDNTLMLSPGSVNFYSNSDAQLMYARVCDRAQGPMNMEKTYAVEKLLVSGQVKSMTPQMAMGIMMGVENSPQRRRERPAELEMAQIRAKVYNRAVHSKW